MIVEQWQRANAPPVPMATTIKLMGGKMKKIMNGLVLLFLLGVSWSAKAAYLTLSAESGVPVPGQSAGCTYWTGTGSTVAGSSSCLLTFPIPIESGKTLSSITIYFYDSMGSQSISASLQRTTLSATSLATTLVSGSDTTTSSSAQFLTLSYGSATSSSYVYSLRVTLNSGTSLRGIKIYYY